MHSVVKYYAFYVVKLLSLRMLLHTPELKMPLMYRHIFSNDLF